MASLDPSVKKTTVFIAVWVLILSVLMQAVFLIVGSVCPPVTLGRIALIGPWDYTMLLGNLFGGVVAIGNFFAMAVTVQKAADKEPHDAKNAIRASQALRNMLLLVVALIGVLAPIFNTLAVIVPLVFPNVVIRLYPLFYKE